MIKPTLSIIIPAKNEGSSIGPLLDKLQEHYPDAEYLVVNDGSTDNTAEIATSRGAHVINHPYSKGNGAAVKSGTRAAKGELLVFLDADGQHPPSEIPAMLNMLSDGYDMVVGARRHASQASKGREYANRIYNKFASMIVGRKIADLTSGFRAVRATYFKRYLHLLPNGFSYPTTITMAFFRAGLSVGYHPYSALKRKGKSHIRLLHDGGRFLIIIFKIGTIYSPLKVFIPISAAFFLLATSHYGFTYFSFRRFTNMSAMLYITSILIFLIGLVSEQISALTFIKSDDE